MIINKLAIYVVAIMFVVVISIDAVTAIECDPSSHPYARGYCAVTECNGGPLSKGSLKVLPDGKVIATQQLETDNLVLGVCGWIEFELYDSNNDYIGYGYTKKECIGAKSPGKAKIVSIKPKISNIDTEIAARVQKIKLRAICGDTPFSPFGISMSNMSESIMTIPGPPPIH